MITFIHVGKCGGTTLRSLFATNKIRYNHIHCRPCKYQKNDKYLLAIRNPVDRFVSAFYWRKYLLENKKQRNKNELKFFKKYKTIDILCEALYEENGDLNLDIDKSISSPVRRHPSHLGMGLDYYIGDFMKEYNKETIIDIVCTETLDHDLQKIFGLKLETHKNNNKKNKQGFSEESRQILKKYLHKDYYVVEKLNDLNLLSNEQYKILKK